MGAVEPQPGEVQALRDQLNDFIRLAQIHVKQYMSDQKLQQRSHRMIQKLQDQLSAMRPREPACFRKESRISASRANA